MKNFVDAKEYPFTNHYLKINGVNLHYIDEGKGDTLIFVHGTPSWSFDFRHLIKSLSAQYRCIALDHIGFGLSDKPADYDYSLQNHTRNLQTLINKLGLESFSLILHDFGGVIGLPIALQNPFQINHLIILNSWAWSIENEGDFPKIKRILSNPLLPFLYKYLNLSARVILPNSFGKHKPNKSILRHYTAPFSSPKERIGTIAFTQSLLKDQPYFASIWEQKEKLKPIPKLFIWGLADKVITPKYLHKWQETFPEATIYTLNSVGHFPQEESPQEVIEAINKFL